MSSPYSQQPGQGAYPGQSGPPAQGQHPGAILDIRPGFFPLLWILYLCKPSYSINGSAPIQGQWKQNTVPVPPGRYEVTVWVKYLFYSNMGRNSVVVDVPPGAAATITWRSPWLVFLKGKITSTVGAIGGGQEAQQGQQQAAAQQGYQQGQPSAQQGYQQQPAQQQTPQQQTPAQQYGYQQQSGQPAAAQSGQQESGQQPAQAAEQQSGAQQASAQGGAQQAPGGWHPDPTHRHQMRYYDGQKWTDHVSDSGVQGQDPIAS